jgi:hypothetical protein
MLREEMLSGGEVCLSVETGISWVWQATRTIARRIKLTR